MLAGLICMGWGRRVQQATPSGSLGKLDDQWKALAALSFAPSPTGAFNPPNFRVHSPMSAAAQRSPAVLSQEAEPAAPADAAAPAEDAELNEKRVDTNDGGLFTKKEFQDYYGDKFEEQWAAATPAEDIKQLTDLRVGQEVEATVKTVLDFGAFCNVGAERDALLHITQISDEFVENIYEKIAEGDKLKAWITSIDLESMRLSISAKNQANVKQVGDFQVGETVQATVKRFATFGAFCDIGASKDALLHVSQIQSGFISHPSEKLSEGQKLTVRVIQVDINSQKVSISCREQGDLGSSTALDPNKTPIDALQIGQVVEGTVKVVMDFGAFVDIGAQKDALLHKSEIADEYVADPSEKLSVGDTIMCRITDLDIAMQRLGVSCKSENYEN